MNRGERVRTAVVLALFAAGFATLVVSSYTQKSATFDEPVHLTTGYAMLTLHDYRIHPESPPLLPKWAALPLLVTSNVRLVTDSIHWQTADYWNFSDQFLYKQNDADRLLYRGRFMIMLLGILLGCLVFFWARELYGFGVASVVLALYMVEPNILAHAGLVTTDLGVTCFIFGALYFLWRTARRLSVGNVIGFATFFALAQISKFSAVLLLPVAVLLLSLRACQTAAWQTTVNGATGLSSKLAKARAALCVMVLVFALSYATVWAAYGFRYAPTASTEDGGSHFQTIEKTAHNLPGLSTVINWADRHRLLPNACAQGFLQQMAETQNYPAYLAGSFSNDGWWYYFPVAFLLKTPITLIVLFLGGILSCFRNRNAFLQDDVYILLLPAVCLAAASATGVDVGLRYILPVYPFVLLAAGKAVAKIQDWIGRRWLIVLIAPALVELATVYPHYLAFFNGFIGGPQNGHRFLVDSNVDWGQDLKLLKRWMDAYGVRHINLAYFGTADPAYYGINCTRLPSAFLAPALVQKPQLPGYVAVSVTNLHGALLRGRLRSFYWPLLDEKPVAVIGYSIYVYRVEREWW